MVGGANEDWYVVGRATWVRVVFRLVGACRSALLPSLGFLSAYACRRHTPWFSSLMSPPRWRDVRNYTLRYISASSAHSSQ